MSISLPSRHAVAVDIPEVAITSKRFVYNFFSEDESINETARVHYSHGGKQERIDLDPDSPITKDLLIKIPRYNEIHFKPIGRLTNNQGQDTFGEPKHTLESTLLRNNINTLTYEHNLSNFNFTGVGLQDTLIDKKIYHMLSGAFAVPIIAQTPSTYVQIDNSTTPPVPKTDDASLNDIANQWVSNGPPKYVSMILGGTNAIQSAQSDSTAQAVQGISSKQSKIAATKMDTIKDVLIQVQLNNKIVGDVVNNMIEDPLSIYSDELLPVKKRFESIQKETRNMGNDNALNEYDSLINFAKIVNEEQLDQSADSPHKHKREILGYVVEKYEIGRGGEMEQRPFIVIENPDSTGFFDPDIKYNTTYMYRIRTIALITFDALALDEVSQSQQNLYVIESLVASRPSKKIVIKCIDTEHPEPPTDFTITWDYEADSPRLMWNFPVNQQRDVKQFQVFRRMTYKQPFELQIQYNFDDSIVKINTFETPDPALILQLVPGSSRNYYIDNDFKKDKEYIYAICSIDAHGMSSNYSLQLAIRFDSEKNRLIRRVISSANAPKTLPNLYLKNDMFIDTIKTTGYEKLKIVFDPDCLELNTTMPGASINRKSQQTIEDAQLSGQEALDLRFLSLNTRDAEFIMNFINTDIQKQTSITIKIDDKRTIPEKTKTPTWNGSYKGPDRWILKDTQNGIF